MRPLTGKLFVSYTGRPRNGQNLTAAIIGRYLRNFA
jgi:hypothetical protein